MPNWPRAKTRSKKTKIQIFKKKQAWKLSAIKGEPNLSILWEVRQIHLKKKSSLAKKPFLAKKALQIWQKYFRQKSHFWLKSQFWPKSQFWLKVISGKKTIFDLKAILAKNVPD
jgi:hypothetical protein